MDVIVLAKKVKMCGIPMIVEVARGFKISGGLGQTHNGERPCFEVFSMK